MTQKTTLTKAYILPDTFQEYFTLPAVFYERPPGQGYFEAIHAMLLDAHVKAALDLRKSTILSFKYGFAGDMQAVSAVEKALSSINLEQDLWGLLSCLEYGYSVCEVIWQFDGFWSVKSIEWRDPALFRFGADGSLYVLKNGVFVKAPDMKFIWLVHEGSQKNPYGVSVLKSCWPIFQAKWTTIGYLTRLVEKYSIPPVIAIAEEASEEALNQISEVLARLESSCGVALTGIKDIKTLSVSGQMGNLTELLKFFNEEIAKAITGQVLALERGDTGSYALGKVHQESLLAIAARDARHLCRKLNISLIPWILELNGISGKAWISFDVPLQSNNNTSELSVPSDYLLMRL